MTRPLAIDLDAIGDTRPLWSAWLESAQSVLEIDPASVPADRGEAASVLDASATRNWRTLLERFTEDHAPAYLRRDAATSAALQSLSADGVPMGVFTDAPVELARVAVAHLGAARRIRSLEAGPGSRDRVLAGLGADAAVVTSRNDLLRRP